MRDIAIDALAAFDWFVLFYFVALNSIYAALIGIAAVDFRRHLRRMPVAGHDDTFANPLTPGVSILIPAHNEESAIVESVRSMLSQRYPVLEVVVAEDGSTDRTFDVLAEAFDLVEVPTSLDGAVPYRGGVHATYVAKGGEPLTVLRKASIGRRADAVNAALDAARHPLVCMVDADAVLDETALLRVAKPFIDDPEHVVATGGVIRAANGCTIERGQIVDARMPRRWLPRIQVIEYLRAFLLGRTGWSRLGGLLIISAAFGLFRRDLVVEVGGLDVDSLGEDAELVARLHGHLREERRPYRVVFVTEPVCWTEVPETRSVLQRQRKRWSCGLAETLWKHRRMMGNPRYGRIGTVVLPYFLLFELLGPVVELVGVAAVVLGLSLGAVDLDFALLFAAAALGYGTLLSVVALAVEEFSYRRYRRISDLGAALGASVLENIGFRQLHAWWRLQGLWQALRRDGGEWGQMERRGFGPAAGAAANQPPAGG
jgi:cellulose synthase/poly-beta-1,6-N-acetylglucosamine synthase-like glycosyltransferase